MDYKKPIDKEKNFRKRFSYDELFRWKRAPYNIKHINSVVKIQYDPIRKGIPYDECYLFSTGVLSHVLGCTNRHVRFLLKQGKLPYEYSDGRNHWFSTAYLKILIHHRKLTYERKNKQVVTPMCTQRLRYICGDIDKVLSIEEARMALKNARAKGSRFENEIANQLKEIYPTAHRGLQFQNDRFKQIVLPDVEDTPFWIECKHQIQPNIRAALRQATDDAASKNDTRIPIAITKANRDTPLVTLKWEDFFGILVKYEAALKVRACQCPQT